MAEIRMPALINLDFIADMGRMNGELEQAVGTGRKSWLFSDTVDGAKASAVIYSLMLTCRACGVGPLAWLRHVLNELPQRAPDVGIDDLLPFKFASKAPRA